MKKELISRILDDIGLESLAVPGDERTARELSERLCSQDGEQREELSYNDHKYIQK